MTYLRGLLIHGKVRFYSLLLMREEQLNEKIFVTDDHYQRLENMYLQANCNEYYQPHIQIQKAKAKIEIAVQEKFFHAGRAVHGSVYFKLLDDAGWFAANSLVTDSIVLTTSFTTYITQAIQEGKMIAHGEVVNQTKKTFICESRIVDQSGNEIARGSGLFAKGNIPLNAEIGYGN